MLQKLPLKYFALVLCAFALVGNANAQADSLFSENGEESRVGRAFLDLIPEMEIGIPMGDFKEGMDRSVMVGKGIAVFYRLKNRPVDIGVRFGDFSYDHLRREFNNIDGIDLVQRIKNKVWVWYGALRVEPDLGLPFPLYFETAAGWRRYYTKTFFREKFDSERFDQATVHSDWGPVYGGAVGIKLIFEKTYNSSFDIQIGFKQSSTGIYYIHNGASTVFEQPLDNLIQQRSDFSMLSLKVCFSFLGYGDY